MRFPLWITKGSVTSVQFDDTGKFALLDIEAQGEGTWYLTDLFDRRLSKTRFARGGQMIPVSTETPGGR